MYDFDISPSEIAEQVRDLVALQDRQRRAATDARFAAMRKAMPPCPSARPAAPVWPAGTGLEVLAKAAGSVTAGEAMASVRRMAAAADQRRQADTRTMARAKLDQAMRLLKSDIDAGRIVGLAAIQRATRLNHLAWRLR